MEHMNGEIKSPKALLVDLDDTIIGNEIMKVQCLYRTIDRFRTEMGHIEPVEFVETFLSLGESFWSDMDRNRIWRMKLREAWKLIMEDVLLKLGIDDSNLANKIANRYAKERNDSLFLFQGSRETLEKLRQSGVILSLLTNGNSETQREKINRFSLEELFDHIFIEGEVGIGKPDPRAYSNALNVMGVNPSDTWMIGDNIQLDVNQPQLMGIKGIWIDNKPYPGIKKDGITPFLTVKSFHEVLSIM